jgi:3-(3-hydroxy-phenyl)propionate hydroxylase
MSGAPVQANTSQDIRPDVDVLLVGLGPVGAALANLLGRYGVCVLAIDQASAIFTAPRAIALDNEALRILQLSGLSEDDFAKVAIPQVQMWSPRFGRFARMNTAGQLDGHPKLVTFFQPELEAALRRRLASWSCVEVRLGMTLESFADSGDGVQVQLRSAEGRTTQMRAKYLVGADGANSLVRRASGLDFKGETYAQDWLVVDAKRVPNPIDHIEFLCDPRRPTPHMVAPGGRQRWEFMLQPGETREQMESPDTVRRLLLRWADADQIEIERTAVYRFHARVATRFSKGRCFLAGDAAHITPPFAGQGLVAGLRDAANLSWKLAWVLRGQAAPAILETYDQERRPHAKSMIALARLLGRLVMPSNRATAFLIHGLMSLIRLVPAGRALFEDLKIKPQNTFRDGLFARNAGPQKLNAGALFPQGWVRKADTGEILLSDDALGPRLTLVAVGVDPASRLDSSTHSQWQQCGGVFLQWCPRGQALDLGPAERRVEALDDSLLPARVPIGWAAVVRPDRTVLAEGPIERAADLVHDTLRLFGMTVPASKPSVPDAHHSMRPSDWRTPPQD